MSVVMCLENVIENDFMNLSALKLIESSDLQTPV